MSTYENGQVWILILLFTFATIAPIGNAATSDISSSHPSTTKTQDSPSTGSDVISLSNTREGETDFFNIQATENTQNRFQPSFGPPRRLPYSDSLYYPQKVTHEDSLNTEPQSYRFKEVEGSDGVTFYHPPSQNYHGFNHHQGHIAMLPAQSWISPPLVNVFDHGHPYHHLHKTNFDPATNIQKSSTGSRPNPHEFHSVVNYGLINVHHGDHHEPHHNGKEMPKGEVAAVPELTKEDTKKPETKEEMKEFNLKTENVEGEENETVP